MTNLNLSEGFHAGKTFTGVLSLKNKHSFPYHHNDVVLHTTAEFLKARLLAAPWKMSPLSSNEKTSRQYPRDRYCLEFLGRVA